MLPPPLERDWPADLDEAAYHGVAGDIVRAVAPFTEADPAGVLITVLVIFGNLAGREQKFPAGDWQAGNEYVVLVGETGDIGRKGTSWANARDVFTAAFPDWTDVLVSGLGSGEGLITHLAGDKTRPPRPRALVFTSEFASLLRVMGRDGSILGHTLREAYDGTPVGRHLAKDHAQVTDHHVSLLGHITPAELRTEFRQTDAMNGTANRILWIPVKQRGIVNDTPPTSEIAAPYLRELHQAIRETGIPVKLTRTPAALDWWTAWREDRRQHPRGRLSAALTGRAATHVTRLAVIYARLDRTEVIDVVHYEAARAVWDFAERGVRWAVGETTGNRHADLLRRYLRRDGAVTKKQAREITGLRGADLQEAMDTLVNFGLAAVGRVPGNPKGGPRALALLRVDET